jgi:hypothetical protein
VLGVLVIGLGILMIFTPGQGILSILVGVGLTDFPGKHELERRLAARRHVLNSMNWLRRHLNRPPLEKPHISGAGG